MPKIFRLKRSRRSNVREEYLNKERRLQKSNQTKGKFGRIGPSRKIERLRETLLVVSTSQKIHKGKHMPDRWKALTLAENSKEKVQIEPEQPLLLLSELLQKEKNLEKEILQEKKEEYALSQVPPRAGKRIRHQT